VLPSALSADPERLRRFEQEAQAAAALKKLRAWANREQPALFDESRVTKSQTRNLKLEGCRKTAGPTAGRAPLTIMRKLLPFAADSEHAVVQTQIVDKRQPLLQSIAMTNISPTQRCKSCDSILVPPVLAPTVKCTPDADYVCLG
jgi:hypothetical protein